MLIDNNCETSRISSATTFTSTRCASEACNLSVTAMHDFWNENVATFETAQFLQYKYFSLKALCEITTRSGMQACLALVKDVLRYAVWHFETGSNRLRLSTLSAYCGNREWHKYSSICAGYRRPITLFMLSALQLRASSAQLLHRRALRALVRRLLHW